MHESQTIAAHVAASLARAQPNPAPYRHWLPQNILPEPLLQEILALPIAPPAIADTQGRRETNNFTRGFFGTEQQHNFPACSALATSFQSPNITKTLEKTCNISLRTTHLRIEYCLDTNGFWLEPHTDIGAKFFTLLIYLADPPPGEDWGTDIYASATEHTGTAPCARNHGLIFIPAANTWHGFAPRHITGTRRSLIINYVTPEWRARHELAFPNEPLA